HAELAKPKPGSRQGEKELDRCAQGKPIGERQRTHRKREWREGPRLTIGRQRRSAAVPAIPKRKGSLLPRDSHGPGPGGELRGGVVQGGIVRGAGDSGRPGSKVRELVHGKDRGASKKTGQTKQDRHTEENQRRPRRHWTPQPVHNQEQHT